MAQIIMDVELPEGSGPTISYVVKGNDDGTSDEREMVTALVLSRIIESYFASTPPEELSKLYEKKYEELVAERIKQVRAQDADEEDGSEDSGS